jgi:hypothetical protein
MINQFMCGLALWHHAVWGKKKAQPIREKILRNKVVQ